MIPIVVKIFGKETGGTGNQRKNRDYANYETIEIDQDNQKNSGDQRRLPLKDQQRLLVRKTQNKFLKRELAKLWTLLTRLITEKNID